MHYFDRNADFAIAERKLPHWSQAGAVVFITWRTADSIPPQVLKEWESQRRRWLVKMGAPVRRGDWREALSQLDEDCQAEFHRRFSEVWHGCLDACHGACVLRRPEISQIVAQSLRRFDGDRYELTDFVVMPNQIHLLASFPSEEGMLQQCTSWKHFTATAIHRVTGGKGRFWQQDMFDHLVRSGESFGYFRQYIRENPVRAKLRSGEFVHFSKDLCSPLAPREDRSL